MLHRSHKDPFACITIIIKMFVNGNRPVYPNRIYPGRSFRLSKTAAYTAGNDYKRLKSCRKRPPFLTVFHRFRAVIRHSRLRNGLHRTGKRRRFRPFPSNNGVPYWHRIFAVYCLKTAVFIRLRLYLSAFKTSEI